MIRAEMLYSRSSPSREPRQWIGFHLSGNHKIDLDTALQDICQVDPQLFIKSPVKSFLYPHKYVFVHTSNQAGELFMYGEVKLYETVVAWPLSYGQDTVGLAEFERMMLRWSKTTPEPLQHVHEIIGWHTIVNLQIREKLQAVRPIEISITNGLDIFNSATKERFKDSFKGRETEDVAVVKLSDVYFPLCKPQDLPHEVLGTERDQYFLNSIVNSVSTYLDASGMPCMYATVSLDSYHPTMFIGLLLSQPAWPKGLFPLDVEGMGKQLEEYLRKKNPDHPLSAQDIPGFTQLQEAVKQVAEKERDSDKSYKFPLLTKDILRRVDLHNVVGKQAETSER